MILTPNINEFKKLCEALGENSNLLARNLAKLTRSIIVQKGEVDCISDGESGKNEIILEYECKEEGTPKRCGGQGDVLAGVIASKTANIFSERNEFVKKTALEKCYESCVINRKLMKETFGKYKMAMITNDALKVFKYLNPS
jgi:ATP-dependent NAD(P)H-hydrate dehydratase